MVTGTDRERSIGPIVYFGNDWFAENRTSSHHIARCLARRGPLLYVECPGLRAPQATARDFRKLWRKLTLALQKPRQLDEQLWHTTLPQIPFRRLPLVGKCNQWLGEFLVRRAVRHVGFHNPILWFVVPHLASLIGRLGERFVVYYCIDDYAALPHMSSEIAGLDDELTRKAHQVFVASRPLLDSKKPLNPTTCYSPHGVDVELFRQASDASLPPAELTQHLAHPVVGFFGLIEAWIDLDLLLFLSRARPQWTFLLIGRLAVDPGELRNLKNMVFAGPQPYDSLPRWARAFDVAILPYRRNRQVWNANPLKLREYLATGKPVVSVSTPEIDRFGHVAYLANTHQEFLNRIDAALAEDCAALRDRRMQSVSAMTWDARVGQALSQVEERMSEIREEVFA